MGGGGGGRADMAQAGGSKVGEIDAAIEAAKEALEEAAEKIT